jgi:hypothetical protein
MPRGYMEGPASEEAERRADEVASGKRPAPQPKVYPAVFGSTEEEPESHFLGWLADLDPDELFASGKAWGVTVRRVAVES